MTQVRSIALWLGIWGAGLAVFAQEAPAYDLAAVLRQTAAANPMITAAQQDVTIARTQEEEARARQRPQVTGQLGYLQLDQDPSFTIGGNTMVFGETSNTIANVSLQWPIYTSGLIERMLQAARHGTSAAAAGVVRRRQEVLAEAAVAYYQTLSARQMVEVMRGQITTLEEAVRIAKALQAQGVVAKLDVLRPEADLAAARATLVQAENGAEVALANLTRVMHLPRETPVTLVASEPLGNLPANLDEAEKVALQGRPELAQLAAAQAAARAQIGAARAEGKPQVGLQVQYDFDRPSTYPEIGDWSIGIVVQQRFLDGGTSRAHVKRAEAQLAQYRAQEAGLRLGITTQVTNALRTWEAAGARVTAAREAVTAAQEAHRLAETSYKNQVVPIIDVLGAQTALTQARVQLALASFDRDAAAVQLRLALGQEPLPASDTGGI